MGYLNHNLEKVASVIEGEMEKKALNMYQLMRGASSAASRGKLQHYIKRIAQRNNAIKKVAPKRAEAAAKLADEAALENQILGYKGPVGKEYARLQNRVPDLDPGVPSIYHNSVGGNFKDVAINYPANTANKFLANPKPVPVSMNNIGKMSQRMRDLDPFEWSHIVNAPSNKTLFSSNLFKMRF